jgi:transcriptional regulator GlxA family with amidase domain
MRVDPRVERMRQHLLTHLEEPTDMKSLARVAGVSRAYAGTLFHKQTGTTVQNYANALRVRKAQALLSDSSETLAEIAEQCGFDDVFYFSKVFKKHASHSPSSFRRINMIRA